MAKRPPKSTVLHHFALYFLLFTHQFQQPSWSACPITYKSSYCVVHWKTTPLLIQALWGQAFFYAFCSLLYLLCLEQFLTHNIYLLSKKTGWMNEWNKCYLFSCTDQLRLRNFVKEAVVGPWLNGEPTSRTGRCGRIKDLSLGHLLSCPGLLIQSMPPSYLSDFL